MVFPNRKRRADAFGYVAFCGRKEKKDKHMAIRIIADSTCDMTAAEAAEWGVTLLTVRTFFGDEEFPAEDNVHFFEKLKASKTLPHTSQVNPFTFEEEYKKILAAGDEGIVVTISGELSGTYRSAVTAKEALGTDKIFVVDSRHAIFAHRLLVEHAVRQARAGRQAAEIAAELEALREKVRFYAAVEDLTYLRKGGRINALEFTIANLLAIKPVVTLRDGCIRPCAKKVGMRKAAQAIVELTEKDEIDFSKPYYIGYSADPSRAELLREPIEKKYGVRAAGVVPVGPAVGTYTGPGCVGIAYFMK